MTEDGLLILIQTHLVRYPEAGLLDMYKLLHQATFGPGHLIANRKTALEWLEHEIGHAAPDPNAIFVESIHPQGAIVRLHLRPYLAYTHQVKPLLEAFIRSAEQVERAHADDPVGRAALMARRWASFTHQCDVDLAWDRRFDATERALFGGVRAREEWPAVHHSPAYIEVYRPAYRVLTATEAEALCDRIGAPYVLT